MRRSQDKLYEKVPYLRVGAGICPPTLRSHLPQRRHSENPRVQTFAFSSNACGPTSGLRFSEADSTVWVWLIELLELQGKELRGKAEGNLLLGTKQTTAESRLIAPLYLDLLAEKG